VARTTDATAGASGSSGSEPYPGERVGLPESGRGSLATWGARIVALLLDWVMSTVLAVLFFGTRVLSSDGWTSWMTMVMFFVQTTVLVALAGASAGQLLCRLAVVRLDNQPVGFLRAGLRALMVCLVLPAVVIGTDRRGLHDLAAGTAVVNRR
jgi:uncharacterized RDD family membrane protein YckC